eukprot:gene2977-3431_t
MLCKSLLKAEAGTQSQMMIEYLKDVSAMLALVRSVREKSIDLHLAAEGALLPKCFAFDHVNYSRYLSAQHVNLQSIKINNPAAWEDLELNGFGGSLKGKPFSTIHGDLITEVTINREVKVRGRPMQGGFSTNERTTDAFIKTSHIIANIRGKLKEKLNVLTSSVHKETTFGSRTENEKAVSNLTKQLESYFNPFLDGPARHMKSGQEIHQSVVDGLLASSSVGEMAYLEFVNTRIKAPNNRVTNSQSLAIIFDSYRISTIKQLTQSRRGTPARRVHITSMEQIMPKGKDWDAFLRNMENKIELVQALVKHYTKENNRATLKIPLMITEEEKTWIIRQTGTEELDSSNHIEADTRIILEVSKSNRPVVVKAADTDILVLMCYAFSACQPVEEWMMKIDSDRYASISCIQNHFDLGSNDKSFEDISKAVKFFHEIIYSGNSKESITETRTKMYQKQKTKSSSSLIPDESSVAEHVKRSDLQTLIWKQCLLQNIVTPTLENRGWKEENNEIMPVWYTGNQLPPCLNKKAQKSRRKKGSSQPPTKRRKVKRGKNEHSADDLSFEDNGYEAQWKISSSEDDTFSGSDNSSSDDISPSVNSKQQALDAVKDLAEEAGMLPHTNTQHDSIEIFEKIIRAFVVNFPESPIKKIFSANVFNENPTIKVYHILRSQDRTQVPIKTKICLPYNLDISSTSPQYDVAEHSKYSLIATINFYGQTAYCGHYVSHLFEEDRLCVCDYNKVVWKSATEVLSEKKFQESVYAVFYLRKSAINAKPDEHLSMPWLLSRENRTAVEEMWFRENEEQKGIYGSFMGMEV